MSTVLAPAADITVQALRTTRGSPRVIATTVGNVVAGDESQRSYRWDQTSLAAESVPTVLGSWAYGGRWVEQGVIAGFANQAGALRGTLCTDLMLGASPLEGTGSEVVHLVGYYTINNITTGVLGQGDGMGPKDVGWVATSMKVVNGGTVFGKASFVNGVLVPDATRAMLPGRWEILDEGSTEVNVKQFGYIGANAVNHTYFGQNFRDDDDAEQAAWLQVPIYGGKVRYPLSTGYKTQPTIMPYNGQSVEAIFEPCAVQYWYGAGTRTPNPTDPSSENGSIMWVVRGARPTLRGVTLRVGGTAQLGHGIGIGYLYGEGTGPLSEGRLLDCDVQGSTASGNGSMKYGLTFDPQRMSTANGENFKITSTFRKQTIACAWMRDSVQSFGTVFDGAGTQAFGGFLGTPNCPWGTGLINDASATTITFRNIDFERVGCWVYLRQYPVNLVLESIQGECVKKLIYTGSGSNQSVCSIAVRNTRISVSSMTQASEGGLQVFSGADSDLVNISSNHPFLMDNATIEEGFLPTAAYIACRENKVTLLNCHWSCPKPTRRTSSYGGTYRGSTVQIGNICHDVVGNGISMPDLWGAENGTGTAVVTGVATSIDVVFLADTVSGRDELAADYKVEVTLVGSTGVLGFPYVLDSERLLTGFKIRVSVAPGGAATTTIRWRCYR